VTGDPDFMTVEDVLLLHEEQLARYGGGAGIRDPGALDSAVAMPRATFDGQFVHEDLFAMAAAYAFHRAERLAVRAERRRASWRPVARSLQGRKMVSAYDSLARMQT